jgi:outer membrane murein-binding lipoprotein Lpp
MSPTDEEIAGLVVWIQGKRMPRHASAVQELLARAKAAESDLSTAREEIAKATEERDAAHADIDTLMQINRDMLDEIEGLRAALQPFADAAGEYDPPEPDVCSLAWKHSMPIEDLRKARAVLSGGNGE